MVVLHLLVPQELLTLAVEAVALEVQAPFLEVQAVQAS
jgi:hypothetical protein